MTEIKHLAYVTRKEILPELPCSESEKRKIFISYKKSDSQKTNIRERAIEKILRLADVAVWYDKNLTPGENYNDEIQQAINDCDVVVLLLTKDILDSGYVWDVEIKMAQERKKAIIPIAFNNIKNRDYSKIEDKLGSVQILKWADDDSEEQETEDFDSDFKRALDRFVVNMDLAKEVESLFIAGKHSNPSELSARQLYLVGCGYIRGIGTEEDDGKGTEILNAVMASYGDDSGSKELKSKAALELSSYYLKSGDQKGTFEYTRKAAELGNALAQYYLGNMYYYSGGGVEKNQPLAVEWYKKAAEDESMDEAMYQLGKAYYYGRGAEKDLQSAADWYGKAAGKGNVSAMCAFAEMLRFGKGVETDEQEAVKWHERAAEAGNTSSMTALGSMYMNGKGVEQDNGQAFYYLKKAVDNGGTNTAYYELGDLYRDGKGTGKNTEEAERLYRIAAENGSKRAQDRLEKLLAGQEYEENDTDEGVSTEAAEVAAEVGHTEPAGKSSPARWLVPLIILLALAAAAAIVQLTGAYDILGGLSELFRITG